MAPDSDGEKTVVGQVGAAAQLLVPSHWEAESQGRPDMADTQHTTAATAELVRYADQLLITERVAVAAFLAGYTDPTRRSYATDLRILAQWCHNSGFNLFGVRRPHLETFARWMEQEGRMRSTCT